MEKLFSSYTDSLRTYCCVKSDNELTRKNILKVRIFLFIVGKWHKQEERCQKKKMENISRSPTLCNNEIFRIHHLRFGLPLLGRRALRVLDWGWIRMSPCCSSCERRLVAAVGWWRPSWRLSTTRMSWKSLVLGWKPHPFDDWEKNSNLI